MHRVETIALRGCDQDGARAVVLDDRVARVFLPVHQVPRAGDVRRPVFPGPLGIGMVEGVVIRAALDDLIERDCGRVVAIGASIKDWIIFDVGPGFEVTRGGQPGPLVAALVEQVPRPNGTRIRSNVLWPNELRFTLLQLVLIDVRI